MSAKYDDRDEIFTPTFRLNKTEADIVCLLFDETVNYFMKEYEERAKEIKLLKRVCLVKTLIYPTEVIVTLLVLGKDAAKERNTSQKYYWKFLRNKIDMDDLKFRLNLLVKNSTLGR